MSNSGCQSRTRRPTIKNIYKPPPPPFLKHEAQMIKSDDITWTWTYQRDSCEFLLRNIGDTIKRKPSRWNIQRGGGGILPLKISFGQTFCSPCLRSQTLGICRNFKSRSVRWGRGSIYTAGARRCLWANTRWMAVVVAVLASCRRLQDVSIVSLQTPVITRSWFSSGERMNVKSIRRNIPLSAWPLN